MIISAAESGKCFLLIFPKRITLQFDLFPYLQLTCRTVREQLIWVEINVS